MENSSDDFMEENNNICKGCDTKFGFIYNRRAKCPLCMNERCSQCVAFPISPLGATSSTKTTVCWDCVRDDFAARRGRFTATPRPENDQMALQTRIQINAIKFITRLATLRKVPTTRAGLDGSGVMVTDIEGIPSFTDGVKNMVRVHRPTSEPEEARLPALIYFHGGGWVLGDARAAPQDTLCRSVARIAKFIVISVNYRLAPENPFPIPVEDSYTAWKYICDNVNDFGIDPEKICIGGDSAGGNIAAAVSHLTFARKIRQPDFLVDIYGIHDVPNSLATESWKRNESRCILEHMYPVMVRDYLVSTDEETKRNDLRLRPIVAARRLGSKAFPPALNIIAWFDTLYDEGMSFARALAGTDPSYDATLNHGANNKVTNIEYGQSPHGFIGMGIESNEALWHICIALRSHFNLSPVQRPT